ncbi:MAG TPA: toxin-antitoxin system HicB family antitoxin [Acidimicrobiia bacterium]
MTDRKSFLLRINPKLHRVLERWAAEDLRSLNSQIEFLLVDAARRNGKWVKEDPGPDRDEV